MSSEQPGEVSPTRSFRWKLTACLGLGLISGATLPTPPPLPQPAPPRAMAAEALPPGTKSALDEPLRLLAQARKSYAEVQDYTCTLIKRERLDGHTNPTESVLAMAVRSSPFSVHLRWLEPRELVGQEACYVEGRNAGRMRVRSSGVFGAVGFVSLDPNDPRARKNSRHSITEAGLGNLLERYAVRWEEERRLNRTEVHIATYEYNRRRCLRVETVHPHDPESFTYSRNVVYFDKETHLPIRVECYDWPRYPGDKGEALEVYSYVNLRLNPGLSDQQFNK